jgi:ATP-binding cassette subfamily B (MDR/TAP) protein 1
MTILFGNLTQEFVEFGSVLMRAQSGDAAAQALIPIATANFRSASARSAGWLACIGKTTIKRFQQ